MTIASALLWHPQMQDSVSPGDDPKEEESYSADSWFWGSFTPMATVAWMERSEVAVWDVEDESYYASPSVFFESYFLQRMVYVIEWGTYPYDESYEGGQSYFAKPEFGPKTRPC